jgi:hypothetical protein
MASGPWGLRPGGEALKAFFKTGMRDPKAVPGAVVAIQSFGDFLGFHPHLHILVSDGCFHANGIFSVSPAIDTIFPASWNRK